MSNFSMFFTNSTWILLPLMIFLIYEAYSENINNKKNDTLLDFILLTSLYFIIRFGNLKEAEYILEITFDTIIVISYLKKHHINGLLTSIIGLIYLNSQFEADIFIIIFKYITYLGLYIFYKDKQDYYMIFTFISGLLCLFAMIIVNRFNNQLILDYSLYYVITYFITIFFVKAEKIIEIHLSYKQLMKEQQLRESLFKISHEIKNPIAVCKGYLDMFDTNNMEHFSKYIPIIKSEINRTLDLLQDFSACNKIKIECDIVDIGLLLEDITKNFTLMFDNKNINFKFELLDDEIYINGDYNRLNQVLVNIIKNSIEAIDLNKNSYIKIYMEQREKEVKIFIEDNGIGISKENMKKINEPFFTTKTNGTGLGLVLSNEIIALHNGTLKYESEENIGTTAIITLPIYNY